MDLEKKRALLKKMMAEKAAKKAVMPQLIKQHIQHDEPVPLSFAQQRLWSVDQMQNGSVEYNMPIILRMKGHLNTFALTQALNTIVQRHHILRTTYRIKDGQPVQHVKDEVMFELPVYELLSDDVKDSKTRQTVMRERLDFLLSQPFDLSSDIMMRGELLRLGAEEHLLVIIMHHIASDGWSQGIWADELSKLYDGYCEGEEAPLLPLSIQYKDYALWQRDNLQGEALRQLTNYWQQTLKGLPTLHNLPTDFPRPAEQSFRGQQIDRSFSKSGLAALYTLAKAHDSTLFMVLNAALSCFLARYSGETDIVIGTPIANRDHSETQGLIGCFLNNLVLRTDMSESLSFTELLQMSRKNILSAFEHQQMPFDLLVETLQPERSLSHQPLFQIMLVLQNNDDASLRLNGIDTEIEVFKDDYAKFDLTLEVTESEQGLTLNWVFAKDLFTPQSVERLADSFNVLLEGIVAQPNQKVQTLPLLTSNQQDGIVNQFNRSEVPLARPHCIHQYFEQQAKQRPNELAIVVEETAQYTSLVAEKMPDEKMSLTYGELNNKANQLAHHLIQLGVKPDTLVGLSVSRSVDMLIGMLGILKAGGAYVAIDPTNPTERVQYMLNDSGIQFLVTEKETARLAGDITSISLNAPEIGAKLSQYTTDNPVLAQELTAKNLAYVIYTSGSTGQPKGVLLEHLGAVNLLQSLDSEFAINENSRVLQFAALGFDAATWEWMMALTQGACLYICSDNTRVNPDKLSDFLLEHKVTHALIPPSLLAHLDMEREYAFQVLIVGGEACDQALAWQWAERFPLYNAYGPSECTVCATISRVQPHQTLNIGSALDNLSIYVLDDEQQIVPIGVEGELHIAGLGLARGYLNQVELTKEKFFDLSLPSGSDLSKFSNPEAKRVYKTGDRVRWLPSGELVFVGRSDDQIKIRGFRIELGEIENALSRHQSVKDALVLAQSAKGSKEKQLVAWVVAEKDAESFLISEQELIEQAKLSLPHYMIPSVFCLMEALPLTVNGKVDKKALPQPDLCSSNVYQAPKTETEHKLASLWSTLLATEQVGRQSNFFSLGGHSLLATKLITEIKQAWEVDLSIRSIFETQTLEDQADLIDRESHVDCRANRRQIIANPNIDKAPLSFSQQRLWFLDRMHPGGSEYNMPAALKLTGKLDIAALESALATVVQRHEVLNTVYVESTHAQVSTKTQAQRTESSVVKGRVLKLQQKDLTHLTVEDKSEEIHRLVTEEASKSFDLSQDMMLRTQLLTLDKENFVLLITMHHIASDGWSMNLLINELSTLYGAFSRQKAAPLPPLPIQYRDYALWQRDWLKGDTLEQHLTYWRKQLSSLPLVHSLPVDFVRPAVQKFQGNQIKQQIDVATTSKLKQLAENNNATLFMAIHTLFAALLSRYSGESDIVMGSPIANRDQLEVKDLIGFFANTLVLRLDTAGNPSFEQLLSHSKETLLQAWEHQHVPFEILVDDLQPERSLSYNPLFQIMLSLNDTNVNSLKFGDVALSPIEQPNHTAQFDLTLDMSETEHGLALAWEYNTELFLPETISRMSQCLQRLIGAVIESPSAPLNAIEILAEVDQQKLNAWSNTAFLDAEVLSVEEQFDLQVKRTPDATALVWNTKRLSYQALQHRADKLAHRLIEQGVQQGDLVGLCLPRGVDLIVSILAIFKAGAAYLPLDPAYPKARLEHMLNDSQADFIITDTEQLGLLPPVRVPYMLLDTPETIAQLEEHHIEFTCLPSNHSAPAYVIYTSGSTGVPKGVKVSRKAAANHIATINDHFKLTSQDRCILSASVNFDAAFEQIFLPLTLGCELHIVSLQEMEVSKFDRYLTQNAISVADLPLAYLSQYLTYLNSQKTLEAKQLTSLELLVVGGEAIPKATVESCFDVNLCRRFINAYGPTEASVTSTAFEITADNLASLTTMLIGQACGPRQLYVVNPLMQRVPVGAVGELLIGGDCLADGYLHRDTLTEERFIDDHLSQKPGAKLYRTGDLVRYHQDGQLEFVGRIDDQVKLRGFRIELGEIETVLMQHEAVIQAVVMIKKTEQGIDQLIAYLVTKLGLESELQHNLSEYLSKTLPDHMIPAIFMSLNELPLTAAGKINRQALLDIKLTLLNSDEPPKSETEQRLASIWCQLLSCQSVCRDSHFFALGGHSLLAVGLISQVRDAWQVELSLKAIFELKTLKGIASQIDNQLARSGSKDFMDLHVMPLNKAPQDALLPVSFAQQRLWFIAQLEPNGYEYNMPEAFYVNGRLEVAAFTRALNSVVERHQILRTVYRVKDQNVYQSVLQDFDSVLELIDISEYSHTEQQVMLENLVEQEAITPFNLSKDLMLRAKLVKLKKEGVETEGPHNAFLITQHHIASDGWSTSVLISELSSAYHRFLTTEPTPLLPLEYQYSDYAYSQRAWLEGERLERHLDYWLQQLADLPPVHHLPLDKARPSIQSFQGAELAQTLSPELSRLILTLAQHNEASLFMVLKAAFSLLLSRYSGETDIVIGTPVANREQVELEPIIGFFVNTLVMRTQVDHQQSFTQLLAQCRDNTLAGLQHQQAPFETLVERLQPERSLSYNPLFQIMLSVENNRQSDFNLDGLEFESIEQEYSTSQFDLSLNVVESEQGIQLHWEYSTDLFEHSSMTRMAEHFDQLLHQIVHRPNDKMSDISILSSDERTKILNDFNGKTVTYHGEPCVHYRFESQVQRCPDAMAVIGDNHSLSYAELNAKANQLAHYLRESGVARGDLVGIYAQRSPEFLVAILAIMKAGGAYIPFDPVNPISRIDYMLTDSGVSVLLTENELLEHLKDNLETPLACKALRLDCDLSSLETYSTENPVWCNESDDLAYMIYTSGSTGQPKGALVHHAGALNHIDAEFDVLDFIDENHQLMAKNFLQSAASSSDVSVWQFLAPLMCGGQTVILDDMTDIPKLVRLLQQHQVHLMQAAPVVLQLLVDHLETLPPSERALPDLEWMMAIAEAAPVPLLNQWLALNPQIPIMNGYGPSEASDDITEYVIRTPLPANTPSVPIGRPIPNLTMYVLDKGLQLQPIGVPGELCVSGVGVGKGYWNKPERTASSFVVNPYHDEPDNQVHGDTLYRTGDLGRWLPDGTLEFMGRIDNQVKVRGFRVELGEVEASLAKLDNVGECAVVIRRDQQGQNALAAYLVAKQQPYPTTAELRQGLQRSLPDYMVPNSFTVLDKMPLNAADKIDRRALPEPNWQADSEYQQPKGELEQYLATLWSELLQLEQVSANANFFDCGGHSLLVARLVAQIRADRHIDVPVKAVFEAPTLAQLALILSASIKSASTQSASTQSAAFKTQTPEIVSVVSDAQVPLSFAQQRMWFIHQSDPEGCEYNMPAAYRVEGALNIQALEQAFSTIIARHHVLHTCFELDDGEAKAQRRQDIKFTLPVIDLSELSEPEQSLQVQALVHQEMSQAFDLSQDLMLRAQVLHLAETRHVLLLTLHHIASDGWSEGVMVNELSEIYASTVRGEPNGLAPLAIQYSDYAHWQRNWLANNLDRHLEYWMTQLADLPPTHSLPLDHQRPNNSSFKGAQFTCQIDKNLTSELNQLARSNQATLFMVLNAAFSALLNRYSGESDIVIGSPIANREQNEIAPLIGCFINTVVLRADLSEDLSFTELLQQSRERVLAAFEHQQLPFELLVDKLQPERSFNYNPLFQVMLSLDNNSDSTLSFSDLNLTPVEQEFTTTQFDLSLDISENQNGLTLVWDYAADLFDRITIERMAEHFDQLLHQIVHRPNDKMSDISILSSDERTKILNDFNGKTVTYHGEPCVHYRFESQVQRCPDAMAVIGDNHSLSYAELNAKANQLAHYLRESGVARGDLVGIYAQRSPEFLVAILAIMKAGGAYIPFDPVNPISRIDYMLTDSGVSVLLTENELLEHLKDNLETPLACKALRLDCDLSSLETYSTENPVWCNESDDLAYMIYTSGSTGQPKGALVHHAGALNHIDAEFDVLDFIDENHQLMAKNFLQSAASSSDVSVWQFLAPLMCGGQTVILDDMTDIPKLVRLLQQHQVHLMQAAPVVLQLLVDHLETLPPSERALPDLEWMMAIAEAAPVPLLNQWLALNPQIPIMNGYGPSEASDDITEYVIRTPLPANTPSVPIGRPIPNLTMYVLDKGLQLQPIGVPGELCVSGVGVGKGYWNKPERTASSFVVNPYYDEPDNQVHGDTLYRTGDLGRWLPDGTLEFMGRIDNQVKVRGFRVELGEVEASLAKLDNVGECAVVIRRDQQGQNALAAYLVAKQQPYPTTAELRQGLQRSLPDYMVPNSFTVLDKMPLNAADKIDRRALPEPNWQAESEYLAPESGTEKRLANIWCELLGLERVSKHANFFTSGGHSILTVKLLTHIKRHFNCNLQIKDIFEADTLTDLAARLESTPNENNHQLMVKLNSAASKDAPKVFCVPAAGGLAVAYLDLAQCAGSKFDVNAFDHKGILTEEIPHNSIEEMVVAFTAEIRKEQGCGPYFILGHSSGGQIAYEVAIALQNQGQQAITILLDSFIRPIGEDYSEVSDGVTHGDSVTSSDKDDIAEIVELFLNRGKSSKVGDTTTDELLKQFFDDKAMTQRFIDIGRRHDAMSDAYQPSASSINDVVMIYAADEIDKRKERENRHLLTTGEAYTYTAFGDHNTMLLDQGAAEIALVIEHTLKNYAD